MSTITHVYPWVDVKQTPIGSDTERDVWDELRHCTLMDESVLFVEAHQYAVEDFVAEMEKGQFDRSLLKFLSLDPLEKTIHIPEQGPHKSELFRLSKEAGRKGKGRELVYVQEVPTKPATTKTITVDRYLSLITIRDARHIVAKAAGSKVVAIWEPDVEGGDLDYLNELRNLDVVIFHRPGDRYGVVIEGGTGNWRTDTSTFIELPQEKPVMLIEHLIPEKALTVMAAPSYTGKTHIAIEVGLALATGTNFLDHFKGPVEPVPVIYHVPELHASLFRSFMQRLGAEERLQGRLENFLIRTLERDLWPLDSPQMIDSSRGRYVFLDTFGYFNDGDDSASYNQAIEFAKKINNLIREGCLGVCGLYHPPKYSKDKKTTGNVMTLENQILGSAGYGGVLRSCLGMRNLHEDSNKGLWVYVQGVKNPGLEGPFQIEGVPLKLIKKPGESSYLSELLKGDTAKREQAIELIKAGKGRREICTTLNVSSKTLSKWKQEDLEFDSNQGDEENDNNAE